MAETKTENKKNEKKSLREKLSILQTKVSVPKTLYNSFGNYYYRNAEGILEAIKPHLEELKVLLMLKDSIETAGERVFIKATAILLDLESEEQFEMSAFAETDRHKGMSADQTTGCASSYARKYALNGLLLLDDCKDEDSDEFKKENDKKTEKNKPADNEKTYSDKTTSTAGASKKWGLG